MSGFTQDVRFALRLLGRDRTFTCAALLTLALCIGANTAMFGILRSVVLKPLPVPESNRIVLLYNSYPNAGAVRAGTSVPDYFDRLASVPALEEQALYRPETMTFGDENGAERVNSLRATPSFYRLVRLQPIHGRLFRDDEGERGRAMKVLLGYAFWQRKFGGNPAIVGQTIRLNGNPFDVVGVLPKEFSFLSNTIDLYVPSPIGPADRSDESRHSNNWQMIGRLKTGASVQQVQAQVAAINAANDDRFPQYRQILKDAGFRTVVALLQDDVVRDVKGVLFLLFGGVLFVLLIGSVNIANLVVVRSAARAREMAARQALGGSASRVARQILTETTMLALAGGALGLLLGAWTLRSIAVLDLDKLPRGYEVRLDGVTAAVALAMTLLVGLAIGAGPALSLRRTDLAGTLQSGGRGSTGGRRANLVRRSLAAAQIAMAFALLAAAGLLLASFRAVLRMDLGFDPARVVTAAVTLPATAYRNPAELRAFERRALQVIRSHPDVVAAGVVSAVPFSGGENYNVILAEGHPMREGESLLAPAQVIASPGYFEAMKIPVVRGRVFDARDHERGPAVAIVDERLAARFWGTQDPIGKHLYFPDDDSEPGKIGPRTQLFTVVGIVKEVQAQNPQASVTPVGTYYLAYEQVTTRALTFAVRTRLAPSAMFAALRHQIAAIDPELPLYRARPMQEWIDRALATRRVPMVIAMAFGVLALLLSAIGVYGVLAFGVAQRRREMGVRLALGSTTAGLFRLVLLEGTRIVTVGLVAGGGAALAAGRLLRAHLYGISATEPRVLAVAAATLTIAAVTAIVLPSWRGTRIDPAIVLND
jgi:predicted permease